MEGGNMMLLLGPCPALGHPWKDCACRHGEQASKDEVQKRQCHYQWTVARELLIRA